MHFYTITLAVIGRVDKEGANVTMERNGQIKHDAHHALCTIRLHRLLGLPYLPFYHLETLCPFATLSDSGNLSIVPIV